MENQKIGSFIAAARKEKEMTQLDLAKRLNVTDKAISKWERGLGFPDIKLLKPLAEALDVSVMELMNGERFPAENSPDIQAYDAALRTYDTTKSVMEKDVLQRRVERWRIFALVSAVCLIYFSCFLFFNEDFLLSYFVIHLPLLSQILAVLLLTFTIIRACRRRKFVLLLILSLFCLTWPVMQFAYYSVYAIFSLWSSSLFS